MPDKSIKDFLNKQRVNYSSISHSPGYTSQEIAASAHISGKILAKTVIVKLDNKLVMVVVPANEHVNLTLLKELTGAKTADIAKESEFKKAFPGCEVGAMPPFGDLYHMPVFISNQLGAYDQIIFNGGSHSELLKMKYRDFERMVHPEVLTTQ